LSKKTACVSQFIFSKKCALPVFWGAKLGIFTRKYGVFSKFANLAKKNRWKLPLGSKKFF